MTAAWITIAVLCAGTVAIKSVGPVAVGGSPPSERLSSVIRLIAPALLAALIVYEALSADGHGPQFDARLVGVAVAGLGLLARLPLLVVVERDVAVATVRAFAERSGAERVVLLLDEGPGAPTLIELTAAGLEIVAGGLPAPEPAVAQPAPLPEIRRPPASALALDLESGELAAPIGTVMHLAEVVLALACAAGGRSVATVDFATRDPELPLTIAAREGEPIVLAIGDSQFLLPEGSG